MYQSFSSNHCQLQLYFGKMQQWWFPKLHKFLILVFTFQGHVVFLLKGSLSSRLWVGFRSNFKRLPWGHKFCSNSKGESQYLKLYRRDAFWSRQNLCETALNMMEMLKLFTWKIFHKLSLSKYNFGDIWYLGIYVWKILFSTRPQAHILYTIHM